MSDAGGPGGEDTAVSQGAQVLADQPVAVYRAMREAMPAVEFVDMPLGRMGVVCHRRDIEHALRHPEIFSSAGSVDLQNRRPLIPLNIDPPAHRRYRKLLDGLLSPRRVAALTGPVTDLANSLLDAFDGEAEVDFGPAFSVPFPSGVFLTLLGLPLEQLPELLRLKDGIIRPFVVLGKRSNHPDVIAYQRRTADEIYAYFDDALDRRAADPGDDLLSELLRAEVDGEALTRDELLDISFLFILAGLDTVTASLDCIFAHLAGHPGHRRRLVAEPSVVPAAVEEMLRYETPVMGVPRLVARDTVLGGCPVAAGSRVTLMIGSANTDEAEFADGDVVDFDRDANRHLAFGGGIHRCLGSHLARLELRIALVEWHRRHPEYHLRPGTVIHHSVGIRAVDHLSLVLGPEPGGSPDR